MLIKNVLTNTLRCSPGSIFAILKSTVSFCEAFLQIVVTCSLNDQFESIKIPYNSTEFSSHLIASPTEANICSTFHPVKSKWHLSAFSVKKLSLNQATSVVQLS